MILQIIKSITSITPGTRTIPGSTPPENQRPPAERTREAFLNAAVRVKEESNTTPDRKAG